MRVIARGDLWAPLLKSLTVASLTTMAAVATAAPAAYVIARLPARLRYGLVIGLLVTRMFPEFAIGVSVATRFAGVGLVDDYLGLILAHLIWALPFIAGSGRTFGDIPRLEEAAAMWHLPAGDAPQVIIPRPRRVAVAALFVWLYSWNEFLYARLLDRGTRCRSRSSRPSTAYQAAGRSGGCPPSHPVSSPCCSGIFGPRDRSREGVTLRGG
jgi:trehalose transport system permease protein